MSIHFQTLSIIIGSIVGVLAFFTMRNPIVSLIMAVIAGVLTEGILRLQNKQ